MKRRRPLVEIPVFRLPTGSRRVTRPRNGQESFQSQHWIDVTTDPSVHLGRVDDGSWSGSDLIGIASRLKRFRRALLKDEHRDRISGTVGASDSYGPTLSAGAESAVISRPGTPPSGGRRKRRYSATSNGTKASSGRTGADHDARA